MRKRSLAGVAFSLAAALALGQFVAVGKMPAAADEPKAKGEAAPGKGKRAQEFIAAFDKGDAKAVAAFWTEDADLRRSGRPRVQGTGGHREAVREGVRRPTRGTKLTITSPHAKLLSPDVALEDGITEVTPAGGGPASAARVRGGPGEEGRRMVLGERPRFGPPAAVQRRALRRPRMADRGLDGRGRRRASRPGPPTPGRRTRTSSSPRSPPPWTASRSSAAPSGSPGTPSTSRIRSWSFYSGGGIGEAVWTKDGDKWATQDHGPDGGRQEGVGDQPLDQDGRRPLHVANDQADRGRPADARSQAGEDEARQGGPAISRAIPGDPTRVTHTPNEGGDCDAEQDHPAGGRGRRAALLTPSQVGAYGAAHVGYTHVGPSGVYHDGATAAGGSRGGLRRASTNRLRRGGGAYHAGYGGAAVRRGARGLPLRLPLLRRGCRCAAHYGYVR